MIKKFVLFLGPVRTGHTFISSLLSAHPKIAISLELQPFKKVTRQGYNQKRIFKGILNNCSNRKSMEMGGYEYLFSKNQNKIKNVEIIGDSIAGFKHDVLINEKSLAKFCNIINIPIKWFIVYRNPFDVVTSFHLMNKKSIEINVGHFISITKRTIKTSNISTIKNNLFKFHIESFIEEPVEWMENICNFLGVRAERDYLKFCQSKVFKKPKRTFDKKLWTDSQIKSINEFIKTIPDLERYHNAF
jgi:hypothetical protein